MAALSKLTPLLDVLKPDRHLSIPLHRQLYGQFRTMILDGRLPAGTKLPSTRTLAADLDVSRNTVVAAFEQLVAEGFLEMKIGVGTLVTAVLHPAQSLPPVLQTPPGQSPEALPLSAAGQRLSQPLRSLGQTAGPTFQPGLPDCRAFPRTAWSRLLARRSREFDATTMGYRHAGGYQPLREAIAAYLAASRGVRCQATQVIIVSSAQAGLDLTLRMLLEPGDKVWHEEPGYNGARAAILGQNLHIYPVPVDAQGMNVAQGIRHAGDARLVYVTPSHHYPTGATLALDRRLELLEWARRQRAWIIEDDYDSEFRYTMRPIAALQGLSEEERVIYLGSFAKTLFPGLKIAYLVVPDGFGRSFIQALRHTGQEPSLPLQAALYDFFEKGYFSRHIRQMRTLYGERRTALIAAIDRHLGASVTVLPSEGGLQLAMLLPDGLSDQSLSALAAAEGITAQPLSDYSITDPQPQGFVLGFAATPAERIDSAFGKLAALIRR